jgi:hypothetical protein
VISDVDNAIEIIIEGGNRPRLSVPSRFFEIELPETGGFIHHRFLLPTQAHIFVMDDLGVEGCAQIMLELPKHKWQPLPAFSRTLPTFSRISGWRM